MSKTMKWDDALRIVFAGLSVLAVDVHGALPTGLVGGEEGADSYGAFISLNGSVSPITELPADSYISSVSINSAGLGVVGGRVVSPAGYAAFVSPEGVVTPISVPLTGGEVKSVSLNQSGLGLIGGYNGSSEGYAAFVQDGAVVTSLSLGASDVIESVAINDAGVGLVGGEGDTRCYAAYVLSDGTVDEFIDITGFASHIFTVAINQNGDGIIGGIDESFDGIYAAFVSPGAPSPTVLSPLPGGTSLAFASAINDAGAALIGGVQDTTEVYVGYVTPEGDVTPLFDSPFTGEITSVALNNSGIGLIGGEQGGDIYAAIVRTDLTLDALFAEGLTGQINSVALNEAGVGLIGGQVNVDGARGYAALVAPNGTLTELTITGAGDINSVALNENGILNEVTPQSAGPYGGAIYSQLAAISALENRFLQKNRVWKGRKTQETLARAMESGELLAMNEMGDTVAASPKTQSSVKTVAPVENPNSIWLEPFGALVYLKEDGAIPRYSNEVGGALLGYDRQGENFLVGTTLGYAFNYVGYSNSLGHAKVQEETLSLYGAYYADHFWAGLALWGGLYQLNTTRYSLAVITAKGSTHGWLLTPHIELATPWALDSAGLYSIEPFVQFDWVNNWQNGYTEHGSSGLNLIVPSVYNGLLQSEVGLRFYEKLLYGWGNVCLEQKLSYVNQAPVDVNSTNVAFVSSASSFPIAVASSKVQNLGAAQLLATFVPNNSSRPYGGFAFETMLGSSYQSYFVSLFVGKDF